MPPRKRTRALVEPELEDDSPDPAIEGEDFGEDDDERSREDLLADLVQAEDSLEEARRVAAGLADDKKALQEDNQRLSEEVEELQGQLADGGGEAGGDGYEAGYKAGYHEAMQKADASPVEVKRELMGNGEGPVTLRCVAPSVFVAKDWLVKPRQSPDSTDKFVKGQTFAVKSWDHVAALGEWVDVVPAS